MIEKEGVSSAFRTAVTGNVFDIPQRLKELDPNFFVMFNHDTQKFEVHDARQRFSTLACALPFDALDARALDYVRGRIGGDVFALARQIDRENEELEARKQREVMDKSSYKMKEALKYLDMNTKTDSVPKELIAE